MRIDRADSEAELLGAPASSAEIVRVVAGDFEVRLAENAAATQVGLSADEIADLDSAADRLGVHGNRYNDHHMALVGR